MQRERETAFHVVVLLFNSKKEEEEPQSNIIKKHIYPNYKKNPRTTKPNNKDKIKQRATKVDKFKHTHTQPNK